MLNRLSHAIEAYDAVEACAPTRRSPLTVADLDALCAGFAQHHADKRMSEIELRTVLANVIEMTRRACARTATDIGEALEQERSFAHDQIIARQVYTQIATVLERMPGHAERK